MTVLTTLTMQRVSVDDLERHYRKSISFDTPRATIKELLLTIFLAAFLTPFFFTTFFVLPIMGQVVVFFALFMTSVYLWARRSIAVTLAAITGSASFALLTYLTIQAVKAKLDIPLFIFLVMGIPVTAIYSLYLAMRIWSLRGGIEE